MKSTAYVTHEDCSRHDPGWNHPEHQGRLPAVARAVYGDMLTLHEPLLEVEARLASEDDLALVHTPAYVERVRERAAEAGRAGRSLPLDEDMLVSGASWEAARAASGAALTAVDLVLAGEVTNAFCAVRPPGRAAVPDRAAAFCIFNNVALATRHLRERRDLERVLVVEWAALPGSALAEILAPDPGVRLAIVADLPPRTGASGYAAAFHRALAGALADFSPDFFLLAAGFDALRGDPLGALTLDPVDYHALTRTLVSEAERHCAGRLVSLLEGGYDAPTVGRAVVQHLRALAGLPPA